MPGYHDVKDDVCKRFNRIEGQVRGLQRMVDEDRYCVDVLTQISSVSKALDAVALKLLDEHLRHCLTDALASGGTEADKKLDEASEAVARLLKS